MKILTALALISICCFEIRADEPAWQKEESDLSITYKLTVSPAADPNPALRFRLRRPENEIESGNAAPFYYRALLMLKNTHEKMAKDFDDEDYTDWTSYSAADFDTAVAAKGLANVQSMFDALIVANRREQCDWGFKERELQGIEVFSFLLPEINEIRQCSRLLALQARMHAVNNDFEKSVRSIRGIYQTANHTASSLFLVNKLVGIAVSSMANEQVLFFMTRPEAPSLYWSLTEFANPPVELSPALRFEVNLPFRMLPILQNADTRKRSNADWNMEISKVYETLALANDLGQANLTEKIKTVAKIAMDYPKAKAGLLQSGMDRKIVDKMPAGQVVAIHASKVYQHIAHEFEKWLYIPFHQSKYKFNSDFFETLTKETPFGPEVTPIASNLLPAIQACIQADARIRRDIASMRVMEAVRMHAAIHEGELPKSLDEITIVPIPLNPATNQPFEYRAEGNKFFLRLPKSDGITLARNFVVTIRK